MPKPPVVHSMVPCTKTGDYVADQLVLDALEFFRSAKFNVDVVDLLMQIAADVLNIHIFIYQKTEDEIEVMSFHGDKCSASEFIKLNDRVVQVLFTRGVISPGGNHYDTI